MVEWRIEPYRKDVFWIQLGSRLSLGYVSVFVIIISRKDGNEHWKAVWEIFQTFIMFKPKLDDLGTLKEA